MANTVRVVLLGCGNVGAAVLRRLNSASVSYDGSTSLLLL